MKIIKEHGKIIIRSGINEEGKETLVVSQTGELADSYLHELGALEMAKQILQHEHHKQINE